MNKYQKYRAAKIKEEKSIAALKQQLFGQLDNLKQTEHQERQSEMLFNEFEEQNLGHNHYPPNNRNILNKAKQVTYSNKGKIQKMRRQIKRLQSNEGPDFMTGVGLFEKQQPQDYEQLNGDSMLKSLTSNKLDDLEELRRMIKKTEKNLRGYSQSLYKTQNHVVSAADKCGWNLDVGLQIKINRCNLDQVHSKGIKSRQSLPFQEQKKRKRITTSYNYRKTKLN